MKWLTAGIISLLLIGCSDDKSVSNDSKASANPIAVKAEDIAKDYKDNQVAGDQKYKDKLLSVSGTVAGIDSTIGDKASVRLKTKDEFNTILAQGDDTFTKGAGSLKKGQKITLVCKGGGIIIGSPVLTECKIG